MQLSLESNPTVVPAFVEDGDDIDVYLTLGKSEEDIDCPLLLSLFVEEGKIKVKLYQGINKDWAHVDEEGCVVVERDCD